MRYGIVPIVAATLVSTAGIDAACAKVPASEAQQLGSTLTPLGAERAGNKDGTIPAWTGGMTQLPAGLTGADRMPDFYKADAIVRTIDANNADQYADKLSPGTMYMLKHYPGYKINIYPTHRPAAAPQWFYDATLRNATTAEIKEDNWVVGAKSGIPFPIPKTGKEAVWNLNMTWYGVQTRGNFSTYIVPPNNQPLWNATTLDQRWHPYADPSYTHGPFANYYLIAAENTIGPPNRVGNQILAYEAFDQTAAPQITWQYLVGQRRLRKAPQVTYDGAYPDCGGITTVDENSLFNGAPDRYTITLLARREMYIPYDNNGMSDATSSEILQPNYLNPKNIRWELHRVWTIDLMLAPGKRHSLPHRRVYLDEDTWGPR